MKRKLLILFIALLAIACNGQQSSKENVKPLTEQEALEVFKKQKHRFEIKGYKIYYNDQLMKLDSVTHFIKRMGDLPIIKEGILFGIPLLYGVCVTLLWKSSLSIFDLMQKGERNYQIFTLFIMQ